MSQLRYAIPEKSAQIVSNQASCVHDEELRIEMICAILVTTADLYILNGGLSLEQIQNAKQLEDIAHKTDILIHSQQLGPHLHEYVDNIAKKLHKKYPAIYERVKVLSKILENNGMEEYKLPDKWGINFSIATAADRIIVVSYSAFDKTIEQIQNAIEESGKSLSSFAKLHFNRSNRTAKIQSI